MTESPSALLERAATLIEQRAAETTDGVWEAHGCLVDARVDDVPEPPPHHGVKPRPAGPPVRSEVVWAGYDGGGFMRPEDALWAVMMSPAVASPLVEWLRDAARRMERHSHLNPEGSTMQRTALAFARQVLGEGA